MKKSKLDLKLKVVKVLTGIQGTQVAGGLCESAHGGA